MGPIPRLLEIPPPGPELRWPGVSWKVLTWVLLGGLLALLVLGRVVGPTTPDDWRKNYGRDRVLAAEKQAERTVSIFKAGNSVDLHPLRDSGWEAV